MDAVSSRHRDIVIPYRMKSVAILNTALRLKQKHPESCSMEVFFDGKLVIEGTSTGFTNAAIEAGILHARALLEFLGLKLQSDSVNRLCQRNRKMPDDVGIEDFGLAPITVAQATSAYSGSAQDGEAALAMAIYTANKHLAHNTDLVPEDPRQLELLEIASRGIPVLVVSHFYQPLGHPPPDYGIGHRLLEGAES